MSIADWLQGTRDEHGRLKLSSRLLLVILEKLPDESQFKTQAMRDGDWTTVQKMLAETHNFVAKHYSAYLQAHGVEGDDVMFIPFVSPVELVEATREAEAEIEFSDESLDAVLNQMGW